MSLTNQQLCKLRSGQMVWRVMFYADSDAPESQDLRYTIEPTWVLGKKVMVDLGGKDYSFFVPKMVRKGGRRPCNHGVKPMEVAVFLGDLDGYGAFRTRKAAVRFVAEVMQGLHPKVINDIVDNQRFFDNLSEILHFSHELSENNADSGVSEWDQVVSN
jgi:hypothetical protein